MTEIFGQVFRFNLLSPVDWKLIVLSTVVAVLVSLIMYLPRNLFEFGLLRITSDAALTGLLWFATSFIVVTSFVYTFYAAVLVLGLIGFAWFITMLSIVLVKKDRYCVNTCLIVTAAFIAIAFIMCLLFFLLKDKLNSLGNTLFGWLVK